MKIEYPKWFNASYKPGYKPTPPSETVFDYKEVSRITTNDYSYEDLAAFPEGANCVTVNINKDYYDDSIYGVYIIFAHKKEVPNPRYAAQKKDYDKRLDEYESQVKEWKKWKKIWDEEQEIKDQARRLKEYKKLKKEFEQ